MQATPRTDAFARLKEDELREKGFPVVRSGIVAADFARYLERESDGYKAFCEKWEGTAADLEERIAKLITAGNVLEDRLGCGCTDLPCAECEEARSEWLSLKA